MAITIDGLRGDIPFRYADRFGPDGFRYLMEQGVVYDNAHYQHSTTFTAVGHATLFTGGNSEANASGLKWFIDQVWPVVRDRFELHVVGTVGESLNGELAGVVRHGVVDSLVRLVLDQREAARARKDWATADAIRDQLKQSGLVIEDSPHGPRWSLGAR